MISDKGVFSARGLCRAVCRANLNLSLQSGWYHSCQTLGKFQHEISFWRSLSLQAQFFSGFTSQADWIRNRRLMNGESSGKYSALAVWWCGRTSAPLKLQVSTHHKLLPCPGGMAVQAHFYHLTPIKKLIFNEFLWDYFPLKIRRPSSQFSCRMDARLRSYSLKRALCNITK